ncbi:MAG TPA: hypothetical protein VI750_13270, partial [Pyrinomonadaceae bacterium]|nr:hypothetical protein [Pyrinomonadaceae bacterium]
MWALRTKTYLLICIILIGCLYLIAFTGILPLFLVYVAAAYFVFVGITFVYLGGLLLKFLPAHLAELHSRRQLRYFILLLVPVVVFVLSNILFQSFAPQQRGILRVFSLTGILSFSAFVLWSLLRGLKPKNLVIGAILFLTYLTIVSGWASTKKKTTEELSREELAALPYVAWVSEEDSHGRTGVTLHAAGEASPGVNLYGPNSLAEAFLTDMNGKVLHKWENRQGWEEWAHVALNENGDLLVIYKDNRLSRLTWDSRLLWRQK